ncbi:MAG: exodeoxyribonuclease VII small subunit [Opitutales bacterium]
MTEKPDDISFENALERLESIIDSMESGEIPLADLVAKFEEGSTLLKVCENRLKEAELKIEQLNPETGEVEASEEESPDS